MNNKEQAEKAFAKWSPTANAISRRDIFMAGYFSGRSDENTAHQLEAQELESRNTGSGNKEEVEEYGG